jgi:hypothetical protein
MARLARVAEVAGHVVGIRRFREISCVTGVTVGIHQLVVGIRMARLTRHRGMCPGQRKPRCGVIERRGFPHCRAVTRFAPVIQGARHVIRVRRSRIVRGMTRIAVREDKLEIVVDVARLARYCLVGTCQREIGGVVVEGRRFPRHGRVALVAGLRIAQGYMIGILHSDKLCPVAVNAVHRQRGKLVVDVTVHAGDPLVKTCQGKCSVVMGECRGVPCRRRVTLDAPRCEGRGGVAWLRRGAEGRHMTAAAILRSILERSVHVARRTWRRHMCSRECERGRIVVEPRPPRRSGNGMTLFAVGPKAGSGVVGIPGVLKIRIVAADTRDRCSLVRMLRCVLVTVEALQRRVPAQEREPRALVPLDHVAHSPRLHHMAAVAVRPKFRLVDVGVTCGAAWTQACQFQVGVAADARDTRMLPLQSKAGFGVLEGRVVPHLPGVGGVTRLARKLNRTVGGRLGEPRLRVETNQHPEQESLHGRPPRLA